MTASLLLQSTIELPPLEEKVAVKAAPHTEEMMLSKSKVHQLEKIYEIIEKTNVPMRSRLPVDDAFMQLGNAKFLMLSTATWLIMWGVKIIVW